MDDMVEITQRFPEFGALAIRDVRLQELQEQISGTTDDAERLDKLTVYAAMSRMHVKGLSECYQKLTAEMHTQFEHVSSLVDAANDNTRIWKGQAEEMRDAFLQERSACDELCYNMCSAMLMNPKATVELLLQGIEHRRKVADGSGRSWQWTLRFPLFVRMRMAWLLVFGNTNKNYGDALLREGGETID